MDTIQGTYPVWHYRGYQLRDLPWRPGYEVTKDGEYIDTQNQSLQALCRLIDRTIEEQTP